MVELGNGFWNLRGSFKMAVGLVDVGTHMSVARLANGRFLVVDTIVMSGEQKAEFDRVTEGGRLIEAVVATHPFHTMAFTTFHKTYPDAKYYGTPRHLRNLPDIPWAGDVNDEKIRTMFEPDVSMRIPAGAEFANPEVRSPSLRFCCQFLHFAMCTSRKATISRTCSCFIAPAAQCTMTTRSLTGRTRPGR